MRIDKAYRFDTPAGNVSLRELFKGRSQLLVYHFMFGPDYSAGCPSCSSIADGFNGVVVHLEHHDVAFTAISRAPLAKLQAFKQRMGWSFDWASSYGSDFNSDFNVWFSEEQQRKGDIVYNYLSEAPLAGPREARRSRNGDCKAAKVRLPGSPRRPEPTLPPTLVTGPVSVPSCLKRRGLPHLLRLCSWAGWPLGMYQWLDRAPKGRNEQGIWWRRHDEYGQE
ncbi:DUF899 family protein [Pseudomonas sp. PCH446]